MKNIQKVSINLLSVSLFLTLFQTSVGYVFLKSRSFLRLKIVCFCNKHSHDTAFAAEFGRSVAGLKLKVK